MAQQGGGKALPTSYNFIDEPHHAHVHTPCTNGDDRNTPLTHGYHHYNYYSPEGQDGYEYPPEAYEAAAAIAWPETERAAPEDNIPDEAPTIAGGQAEPQGHVQAVHDEPQLAETSDCAKSCARGITGPHKCFRSGLSLRIQCCGRGCSSMFKTKSDFHRHVNTIHTNAPGVGASRLLDCPVAGCSRVGRKGFKRRDNLIQHRRGVHGEEIQKVKYRFGA